MILIGKRNFLLCHRLRFQKHFATDLDTFILNQYSYHTQAQAVNLNIYHYKKILNFANFYFSSSKLAQLLYEPQQDPQLYPTNKALQNFIKGFRGFDYDLLAINVGSRTRGANETPGVKEYSLSTRPINDLLSKIQKREKELIESKTIPEVVVCGSGAAGVEMAFGFKKRWSKLFNKEIKVAIVCPSSEIFPGKQNDSIRAEILRKFSEKNIAVHYDAKVKEIQKNSVVLQDGRVIPCDVPVWATGAEAQKVTMRSDLDVMNDYFRVNDYMQSTSHSNVFAGGDCVTMENYSHDRFPPKAGVYAVRAGPIIAQNLVNSILDKPLVKYVPQSGFLALLMTADEKAIGSKFGIAFAGKWVWKMKDRIDTSFMKLFDPMYLYKDYAKFGCAFPVENNNLFENELYGDRASSERIKERVFLLYKAGIILK